MRWPILSGSPVLDSLRPVIQKSRDVHTNVDKIIEVAGWMGYEELPFPEFTLPFGVGAGDSNEAIDFILVADSVDTAFTDFSTHQKFQVDFAGRHWFDSEAEFACLKRALDSGIPILDRIPVVGNAFGSKNNSIARTELILFIRPQIIHDGADASVVAEELRSKMRGGQLGSLGLPKLLPEPHRTLQ